MPTPINANCGRCGQLKTRDNARFIGYAKRDGVTELFRSPCNECAALDLATIDRARRASKERKRRERRATGVPEFGKKPFCPQGHERTPENLRPGRSSCAICHREQTKARAHAKGVKPHVKRERCPAGHPLVPGNLRQGKRHAGQCLLCHRLREQYSYDDDSRAYIAILANDPCSYCGGPGGTIDHIVARRDGGTDDWWNLTASCFSCNARKRTIPLLQFVLRRPMGSCAFSGVHLH